jgi:hypothetical protein
MVSLYVAFARIVDGRKSASAGWPKTCYELGNELHRIAPQMRMHDISVTIERTYKGRFITLASEAVPIIQATRANPAPVSSSSDEKRADIQPTRATLMRAI